MTVGFSESAPSIADCKTEDLIYDSWMQYLTNTLGRDRDFAHERAMADVTRDRARSLVAQLKSNGWDISNMSILDLGSGHGTLAVELAMEGARVTAVEPCHAWREISIRRAKELGLNIQHSGADGAGLPFPSECFDGCVSLQVLEHVNSPDSVIREIARVLRNDGLFFITAENYLSFREQHYGLPWLPLLPKSLGALYLRAKGKDPKFLRDHVTYCTWPGLANSFIKYGLIDDGMATYLEKPLDELPRSARTFDRLARLITSNASARRLRTLIQSRYWFFHVGFKAAGSKRALREV